MKNTSIIYLVIITLSALLSSPLYAGGINIDMVVQKVVQTKGANGNTTIEHVPADITVPGDVVIYTTTYHNEGDKPADKVSIVNVIPKEVRLITDSLKGNAAVTYSVDDGVKFDSPENLHIITEAQASRLATADDYTHLRWFIITLTAGKAGEVSFQARIREN